VSHGCCSALSLFGVQPQLTVKVFAKESYNFKEPTNRSHAIPSPLPPSIHEPHPHEKLLGMLRVSNPATRKDLADRTWGGSGTNPK